MTNAILRGKPDAGKSHFRFGEGEVASAKPRHGSLLYMPKFRLLSFACAVFAVASGYSGGFPERGMIAHRGDMGTYPENTVEAFKSAVLRGVEMVEFDVKRCKTGELVVIHDADVSRTTDGKGQVGKMTFGEIRKLDAGVKSGYRFKGIRVPSFEEAIACFPKDGPLLNIHLGWDVAEEVAHRIVEAGRERQAVLMSNPTVARRLRATCPGVRVGFVIGAKHSHAYVFKDWTPEVRKADIDTAVELKVDFLQMLTPFLLTDDEKARLRAAGVRTTYFSANAAGAFKPLVDAGYDFIFTDNVERYRGEYLKCVEAAN